MKRYLPAGGVCEFQWCAGSPPDDERYGCALVEVWEASLSGYDTRRVNVDARVRAIYWDDVAEVWRLIGGNEFALDELHVRRWCRLPSNSATLSVTVEDWRL